MVMECREDEIKSKIDLAVKIENLLGIAKKQMFHSSSLFLCPFIIKRVNRIKII